MKKQKKNRRYPGINEFEWIRYIQKFQENKRKKTKKQGPGNFRILKTLDDCAFIEFKGSKKNYALTCDTIWENIHFKRDWAKPYEIGWKGLVASYSDLAAKGVNEGIVLLTAAFPKNTEKKFAHKIWQGIYEASNYYNLRIVGGNTVQSINYGKNSACGPIMLDFFLMAQTKNFPLRSDALNNDLICTIGSLGLAKAGLEVLREGLEKSRFKSLVKSYIKPVIKKNIPLFIKTLLKKNLINAGMDISDGLAGDLNHILEASNKNGEIYPENLIIHPELKLLSSRIKMNPIEIVLAGGEDFVPLFTIREKNQSTVERLAQKFDLVFSVIGKILPGPFKKKNAIKNLPKGIKSFSHFDY